MHGQVCACLLVRGTEVNVRRCPHEQSPLYFGTGSRAGTRGLMIQSDWLDGKSEDTPSSPALGLQVLVTALAFYIGVGAETQSLLLT